MRKFQIVLFLVIITTALAVKPLWKKTYKIDTPKYVKKKPTLPWRILPSAGEHIQKRQSPLTGKTGSTTGKTSPVYIVYKKVSVDSNLPQYIVLTNDTAAAKSEAQKSAANYPKPITYVPKPLTVKPANLAFVKSNPIISDIQPIEEFQKPIAAEAKPVVRPVQPIAPGLSATTKHPITLEPRPASHIPNAEPVTHKDIWFGEPTISSILNRPEPTSLSFIRMPTEAKSTEDNVNFKTYLPKKMEKTTENAEIVDEYMFEESTTVKAEEDNNANGFTVNRIVEKISTEPPQLSTSKNNIVNNMWLSTTTEPENDENHLLLDGNQLDIQSQTQQSSTADALENHTHAPETFSSLPLVDLSVSSSTTNNIMDEMFILNTTPSKNEKPELNLKDEASTPLYNVNLEQNPTEYFSDPSTNNIDNSMGASTPNSPVLEVASFQEPAMLNKNIQEETSSYAKPLQLGNEEEHEKQINVIKHHDIWYPSKVKFIPKTVQYSQVNKRVAVWPKADVALIPPNAVPRPINDLRLPDSFCQQLLARYAIGEECDSFIECKNGKAQKYLCPDGLVYNPQTPIEENPCYYPKDVSCNGRKGMQKAAPTLECPRQFGYYRISDPYSCSKYRVCNEGVAHDFECPQGLVYDSKTYRCEWAEDALECIHSAAELQAVGVLPSTEQTHLRTSEERNANNVDIRKMYYDIKTAKAHSASEMREVVTPSLVYDPARFVNRNQSSVHSGKNMHSQWPIESSSAINSSSAEKILMIELPAPSKVAEVKSYYDLSQHVPEKSGQANSVQFSDAVSNQYESEDISTKVTEVQPTLSNETENISSYVKTPLVTSEVLHIAELDQTPTEKSILSSTPNETKSLWLSQYEPARTFDAKSNIHSLNSNESIDSKPVKSESYSSVPALNFSPPQAESNVLTIDLPPPSKVSNMQSSALSNSGIVSDQQFEYKTSLTSTSPSQEIDIQAPWQVDEEPPSNTPAQNDKFSLLQNQKKMSPVLEADNNKNANDFSNVSQKSNNFWASDVPASTSSIRQPSNNNLDRSNDSGQLIKGKYPYHIPVGATIINSSQNQEFNNGAWMHALEAPSHVNNQDPIISSDAGMLSEAAEDAGSRASQNRVSLEQPDMMDQEQPPLLLQEQSDIMLQNQDKALFEKHDQPTEVLHGKYTYHLPAGATLISDASHKDSYGFWTTDTSTQDIVYQESTENALAPDVVQPPVTVNGKLADHISEEAAIIDSAPEKETKTTWMSDQLSPSNVIDIQPTQIYAKDTPMIHQTFEANRSKETVHEPENIITISSTPTYQHSTVWMSDLVTPSKMEEVEPALVHSLKENAVTSPKINQSVVNDELLIGKTDSSNVFVAETSSFESNAWVDAEPTTSDAIDDPNVATESIEAVQGKFVYHIPAGAKVINSSPVKELNTVWLSDLVSPSSVIEIQPTQTVAQNNAILHEKNSPIKYIEPNQSEKVITPDDVAAKSSIPLYQHATGWMSDLVTPSRVNEVQPTVVNTLKIHSSTSSSTNKNQPKENREVFVEEKDPANMFVIKTSPSQPRKLIDAESIDVGAQTVDKNGNLSRFESIIADIPSKQPVLSSGQKIMLGKTVIVPVNPSSKSTVDPSPVPENAIPKAISGVYLTDSICNMSSARFAVEGECDTYVECQNGKAWKYLCPDGLHFSPDAPLDDYPCWYPKDVSCNGRMIIQKALSTADCPHQFGYYRISDPHHCGRFRMCNGGIGYDFACPDGLAYNEESYRCEWADQVKNCNTESYFGFKCPEKGADELASQYYFYKNPNDCTKFYLCVSGVPRLLSCDEGKAFDDGENRCLPMGQVPSCHRP